MKSRIVLLLLAGLFFGAGLGFTVLLTGNQPNRPPTAGSLLADFKLRDLNNAEIQLSDLRGKPVLLNFWATWCVPCKTEMPLLQQSYQKFGDKMAFFGVNQQETLNVILPYLKENGISFPILLDETGEVTRNYYIEGLPTTYFIDASGILRAFQIGPLTDDMIKNNLATIGIQP